MINTKNPFVIKTSDSLAQAQQLKKNDDDLIETDHKSWNCQSYISQRKKGKVGAFTLVILRSLYTVSKKSLLRQMN